MDTILVTPPELTLRVGETVTLFFALTFTALDSSGSRVTPFAPAIILQRQRATDNEGPVVRGIQPGSGTLYVEALARDPDIQLLPRRPSTRVVIRVVP